ncbi:MAG TPA: 4-hydroxy-tetrahydrodipicolinate synthase [Ferruginibacter sp.]|nr:4-hydroxy-tetrahydrodipicolinate synthase [Ferruginibacter sp.]HRO17803.1 4-hydroxy-tetrahydrodipicolinate synthase [Ferruginibacter sp.]HRQ20645.1 4-hydroxy-tetrahydrodipicolinate synthase [Ferruginibacter sp.]
MLKKVLRGTGVAIVTPFKEDESIDHDALERLIEHIITGGAEYIVSLGTTGETPVLSSGEKKDIIHFTAKTIRGRVPMVVGCGGNHTRSVVDELRSLPLEDAVAVLSASPYYNKPSQEGIYRHYVEVAAASPVPVILYNVPGRTGRNMTAATTLRLAEEKNIAGIKEASGDMMQVMDILKSAPEDFLVVSGDDALALPQLACGMDGVISVAANAYPNAFSDMVRLSLQHRFSEAKKLNDILIEAYNLMFAENNPAGVKAFLESMNIIRNILRLPGVPVAQNLREAIHQYVNEWK